ncbi:MAG: HEAT repeat domain-containing protein, partial [Methylobacter sp.]
MSAYAKYSSAITLIFVITLLITFVACSSVQPDTQKSLDLPLKTTPDYIPPELLGHGARLPTADELEQEKIYDNHQVDLAIEMIKSADAGQRLIATETLNAYQTPKAEQQLCDTLLYDDNAHVRQSAAQSLSFFKVLSNTTIKILLKSIHDKDKNVRRESLNVLLSNALRTSGDSEKFEALLNKLRKEIHSGHLHDDIRTSLKEFIK